MSVSGSPRVIHGMSVRHCRFACQRPIGLPQRATDSGYHCQQLMYAIGCVYIRRHRGWPTPTHVVDTCICSRSFPLPEDFWLMYKLMYISCLLTVTPQSITYWYCLHRMWHWYFSRELSTSVGTIICINSCVTKWFVGIVQCLRGFMIYRVMAKYSLCLILFLLPMKVAWSSEIPTIFAYMQKNDMDDECHQSSLFQKWAGFVIPLGWMTKMTVRAPE